MASLSSLLKKMPTISQSRMVASGYGVWLAWSDGLHNAISHTLKDYGAVKMAGEEDQALWFSQSSDIFRALARLRIWAKLNSMTVFCQVLPVTFQVGYDLTPSLSVPAEFGRQEAEVPDDFEIWVHPKMQETVQEIRGLELKPVSLVPGLASGTWFLLSADQGLDYESSLSWFYIVKPLGKTGEKQRIIGWKNFFGELEDVISRLGLKFITDPGDGTVVIPLDNIRLLRTWCGEVLNLIRNIKGTEGEGYWPCVMAAIRQDDLPFNTDLPGRVGLDWNKLTPDLPYIQFKDAFSLGEQFHLKDVNKKGDTETLDSWCTISTLAGDDMEKRGALEVTLATKLVMGEEECFYCGLKNHDAKDCPSKTLTRLDSQVWQRLARIDMKDYSGGVAAIEADIDPEKPLEGLKGLLYQGDKLKNLITRAIFEINSPVNLRMLQLIWRNRGKEWHEGFKELAPEEGEYIWAALESLRVRDYERSEELLRKAMLKYPRSYQPQSLLGFIYMENGDYNQAEFYWQEAERLSYTPLQQSYFLYLQARVQENSGELKDAANLFQRAYTVASGGWREPLYRQGVCMVKMGFTGQALDIFLELIDRDPNIFNRILIDPELERGRVHILNSLWDKWDEAESGLSEDKKKLEAYTADVAQRFEDEHDFYDPATDRLKQMGKLAEIGNYVAFRRLEKGIAKFSKDLEKEVGLEIKRMNRKLEHLFDRLRDVQGEAAWFPFPKLLLEFNRDFNYCVEKIRWIKIQHLKKAENFRSAMRFIVEIESRIDKLQGQLVTLRIVRDSTLFIMIMGRSFIWFELVGLALAIVALPVFIYLTQAMPDFWLVDMVDKHRWDVQKGLIFGLSFFALVLALLKSLLSFEKKKRELFRQAGVDIDTGKSVKSDKK